MLLGPRAKALPTIRSRRILPQSGATSLTTETGPRHRAGGLFHVARVGRRQRERRHGQYHPRKRRNGDHGQCCDDSIYIGERYDHIGGDDEHGDDRNYVGGCDVVGGNLEHDERIDEFDGFRVSGR